MTDTVHNVVPTILHGLPGGSGCAIGPVFHWQQAQPQATVTSADPSRDLQDAFHAAQERLLAAQQQADATLAPLLEAQRLMLDDPDLRDGALALVTAGSDPVSAVTTVAGQLADMLEHAGSEYFRERAIDIRAVGKLVADFLTTGDERKIPCGAVVIAEELAPLDTAQLAEAGISALVTVHGGPTCHAAIIARAWGIPAVVGAPRDVLDIVEGTPVLVDGTAGNVTIEPPTGMLAEQEEQSLPRITRHLPLYANIGSLAEAKRARDNGAEGIGLLRTEFLFQNRETPPSEDEQAAEYTAILQQMDGRPVTIRTLDIGADKPVPFLPMPPEPNPQLGLRGIRLCLQQRELLTTQLRALVRASTVGPLKIMLPMVTNAEEVSVTRHLLTEIAADLNIAAPPLGAMIEVPMAALSAPELATVCEFFSIGTNDLMQFLLAADRQHAGVGYLHAGDLRAAWRLIEPVIAVAHAAHIPVSVCGEWGADPEKLPQLVEYGIDTVSVSVGSLPRVQKMFAE
ncbi:MAG TPA: phosphoenolpyruvate--protein phosphotransferase [Armatimonadota bacterium]|nr:phosphoenolpyruvate--protein phosphotransferase [Armatimonadota bacterium]